MTGLTLRTNEGAPTVENATDIFKKLETLIKTQWSTEEKLLSDVLTEFGAPFVSVGILDAGEITATVLGSPKNESGESINNDTLFQAASISKAITALAVIKLCQEGKLDLDAPISKYLSSEQISWISTPSTQHLVSHITLRHLLSHTSGLRVHGFEGYTTPSLPHISQILRGDPPSNSEQISLFTFPGLGYSYSGGGFTVIQLILETHFSKPFPQIMSEIVLQPLNMSRSTFRPLEEEEKNFAPAYLTGKRRADVEYHLYPETAAAALWTTPSDILKAVRAVQKSLVGGDFLEKEWAERMLTPPGKEKEMALGWGRGEFHFEHSGGNYGYVCHVIGFADVPLDKKEKEKEGEGDSVEKKEVASQEEVGGKNNDSAENAEIKKFEGEQGEEKEGQGDSSEKKDRRAIPKDCGICFMTSSELGFKIGERIVQAIPYMKGWTSATDDHWLAFLDRDGATDVRAKDWCGNWGPGDWSLVNEEAGMYVQFGNLPRVRLFPGVIASQKYDEGESVDLVPDGLDMMLRLGWKDGSRIVEVWQMGQVNLLERKLEGA